MAPIDRRASLRAYLTAVTRDLLQRWILRHRVGHSLEQIIEEEPAVLIGAVLRDFQEEGLGLVKTVKNDLVDAAMGAIGRRLFGG